jgi:hypothetical protein
LLGRSVRVLSTKKSPYDKTFFSQKNKKNLAQIGKLEYSFLAMKALNYSINTNEIATQLKGATVRYLANKSSITKSGVRVFKIEEVDNIGFSKKGNNLFVTVKCFDIDDNGESKYRTLQVAGIELVV